MQGSLVDPGIQSFPKSGDTIPWWKLSTQTNKQQWLAICLDLTLWLSLVTLLITKLNDFLTQNYANIFPTWTCYIIVQKNCNWGVAIFVKTKGMLRTANFLGFSLRIWIPCPFYDHSGIVKVFQSVLWKKYTFEWNYPTGPPSIKHRVELECTNPIILRNQDWPNPVILKNGDGIFPLWAAKPRVKEIKILYESWKVQLNFPMKGLAGIVKKNFPMSGGAANGEIFFYYDC